MRSKLDMEPTFRISFVALYRQWILLFAWVAIGVSMVIPAYWARMWGAGHYHYFPVVILAVAVFLWTIRDWMAEASEAPRPSLTTSFLLGLSVLLCFANLLYSHFLCSVAIAVACIAAMHLLFGLRGLKIALPVLALLLFAIPLPLRLDEWLIIKLQFLASDYSSRLLDLAGVIHFRQGVLLQTYQKQFLTEEACSGIRSLFSSWTLVGIFGVGMGQPWWRIFINLIQTVPWVFIGNVFRITAVVTFADVAPWIATGWGHEILGLLVCIFILAMVACVDYAISRWLRIEWSVTSTTDRQILPMIFASLDTNSGVNIPKGSNNLQGNRTRALLFPLTKSQEIMLIVCLVGVSTFSIHAAWMRIAPDSGRAETTSYRSPIEASAPDSSILPADLGGLKQKSFEHINRGPNFLWARSSYAWEYSDDEIRVIISLDSPWDQWHNLNVCYSNIGWTTEAKLGIPMSDEALQSTMPEYKQSELIMKKAYQWAFVVFSAIDQQGRHVQEPPFSEPFSLRAIIDNFWDRLQTGLGLGERSIRMIASDRLPLETIQLYASSARPLTPRDHDKLRAIFFEARRNLVAWKGSTLRNHPNQVVNERPGLASYPYGEKSKRFASFDNQ